MCAETQLSSGFQTDSTAKLTNVSTAYCKW